MSDDFLDRYTDALGLSWKKPPKKASRQVRKRPTVSPLPPPPASAPTKVLRPKDVRAATLEAPGSPGAMITQSIDGADVTLMITPPEGDALWTIQGRVWLNPRTDLAIRVALTQGENVLAEQEIRDGGSFRLQDLLLDDWNLELHVEDGRVLVVRGPKI